MKIGDKVYQYDNAGRIYESKIIKITKYPCNYIYDTDTGLCFDDRAIDSSIFLTRQEAEERIRERQII